MSVTEMQIFNYVKENLKGTSSGELTARFVEKYPEHDSGDGKALYKRMIRVYDKIKKWKQQSQKKINGMNLIKAEVEVFQTEPTPRSSTTWQNDSPNTASNNEIQNL